MSAQTIVAAAKAIVEAMDAFEQVEDLDAVPFAIYPQNTPCCLLQLMREPEVAVTHGRSQVNADLDAHIWKTVGAPTPESAADFKTLVNDTVKTFRAHPRLDGLADIAGESQILLSGRQLAVQWTRPLLTGKGAWLHAVITNRVVEFVTTPL